MKINSEAAPAMRLVGEAEYEQHLRSINVYGYTVIKDALDAELVAELKARVGSYWDGDCKREYSGRPDRDSRDKVVYNLQSKHKIFIDLLCFSTVRQICMEKLNDKYYRFIPPENPNYILSYYNARSSGAKLDLHIDSYVPNPGQWCTAMQVVYLLDDTREENGCTVVVPGS